MFLLIKGGVEAMIHPGYFDISLVIITIAYLVTWHGDYWAGAFALMMGILIDVLSASPLGLFSVTHLILFFAIRIGDALFDLQSVRGQVIVVFLAVMLKKLLFPLFMKLLSMEVALDVSVFLAFLSSAIFTAVAAPAVFLFFDVSDRILKKVSAYRGRSSA
jgi:rod shape-determining protein MreD